MDEPGAVDDLDELIGQVRREAARRRASPAFPIDTEATIEAAMDRLGPIGSPADLPAVIARLRRLASAPEQAASLRDTAGLTASAVRVLTSRLDRLEKSIPAPPATPRRAAAGGMQGPPPPIEEVADRLAVSTLDRPVLVAGRGSPPWIDGLAAPGTAVYAVDPDQPVYAEEGPIRSGGVLEHLHAVGDAALGAVVLVGELSGLEMSRLYDVGAELARVTASLAVWSEAPWAWRLRVGDATADLADRRPASPETWMAVLGAAGWRPEGGYGRGGADYLLVARTGR